jgi:hypothetical protein
MKSFMSHVNYEGTSCQFAYSRLRVDTDGLHLWLVLGVGDMQNI